MVRSSCALRLKPLEHGSSTHLTAQYADSLSVGLFDDEGNHRVDGLYSYELRGVDPDEGSLVLDSGFFSIVGGSIVDPNVAEATGRLENGPPRSGTSSAMRSSAALDVRGDVAVTGAIDGRDVGDDGAALDAHEADVANPHQMTAAQVGADPSETAATEAAAAVAAHEAAYNHGPLEAKRGRIWKAKFSGNPAMATATFNTPFPSGTNYIVLLTANTNANGKAFAASVRTQNESGFTVTLGESDASLNFVGFLAYPLN